MPLPTARSLLLVALVSSCALAFQLLLMRLLSIIQWHHFAFLIISLALLGYAASGVFLNINQQWRERGFGPFVAGNLLLLALLMPGCFWLAQQLAFNPAQLLSDPLQLLVMLLMTLLLTLPFFCAANIIGASLYQYHQCVGQVYAADLLGAALGGGMLLLGLQWLWPEQLLWLLPALLLLVALLCLSGALYYWRLLLLLALLLVLWLGPAFTLQVSAYKSLPQLLQIPGAEQLLRRSGPMADLRLVSLPEGNVHHAPGLSIISPYQPPAQWALIADGHLQTALDRPVPDSNMPAKALRYLDWTAAALPYALAEPGQLLLLDAGNSRSLWTALFYQVPHITAVQANAQLSDWLQQAVSDFVDDKQTLHWWHSQPRAYLAASTGQYDLVVMPVAGQFAGSGLYSMAQNNLLTVEAVRQAISRLSDNGWLLLESWNQLPPQSLPRLLTTLQAAYQGDSLEAQLLVLRNWQSSVLLFKNSPLTPAEIDAFKAFSSERQFDRVYYPGITADEANHYHRLRQPLYFAAVQALLGHEAEQFVDDYKMRIDPVTDDRPYFAETLKWQSLPEWWQLHGRGGDFLLESGFLLLLAALLQALLLCLLLLILPLLITRQRLSHYPGDPLPGKVVRYFLLLGLGFMFIEIAFIQKLTLILEQPIYAVTLVVAGFLLSAGFGSLISAGWSLPRLRRLQLAVVMIALISLGYLLSFSSVSAGLLALPAASRYLCALLLILPLGFFMGVPFPTGLSSLGEQQRQLMPWAWAINGCASVLSPILATLLAMQLGFQWLLVMAVLLYLLALTCFPERTNTASGQAATASVPEMQSASAAPATE